MSKNNLTRTVKQVGPISLGKEVSGFQSVTGWVAGEYIPFGTVCYVDQATNLVFRGLPTGTAVAIVSGVARQTQAQDGVDSTLDLNEYGIPASGYSVGSPVTLSFVNAYLIPIDPAITTIVAGTSPLYIISGASTVANRGYLTNVATGNVAFTGKVLKTSTSGIPTGDITGDVPSGTALVLLNF